MRTVRVRRARTRPNRSGQRAHTGISDADTCAPAGLRISVEELRRQEIAIRFQIVSGEIHRFALDEILHRIGGDQSGVIAGGVGRPESVAVNQDLDVRAEDGVLARRLLPVRDPADRRSHRPCRNSSSSCRWQMYSRNDFLQSITGRCGTPAASASANSSSGLECRRRSIASIIANLSLPLTAYRKGKPNFSFHALFRRSRRSYSSWVSLSSPAPACSLAELGLTQA